ncbi:MAG: DUF4931 domain-containing protein [Candidatus Pacebacteria bacterium]|nr:DUF4931 domain-containing protein [Candidatus Paceibacterota bacterium]
MLNEFRQDLISGEWILFSTARAKKPHPKDEGPFYQSKEECFFEPEKMNQQETPVVIYNKGQKVSDLSGEWTTVVIPNKFPALTKGVCSKSRSVGPFAVVDGNGFHELVITRDHEKSFAQFSEEETSEILRVYLERYREISKDDCGQYISIFHNHGRLAGGSVYHHHSQIISMPMVPSFISRHLDSAKKYFDKTGKNIHQDLIDWEVSEGKRIVYQNEGFIAICPYVSKTEYEIVIFPKKDKPDFIDISEEEVPLLANILNGVLGKLYKALDNVDYAFFIHTVPPNKEGVLGHANYRWHLEIIPRVKIDAGLELGTGVLVNTVDPDEAANLLRNS